MEDKDIANVSVAALDSVIAYCREVNRRLAIIAGVALFAMILMVGGFVYFFTHFDLVAETVTLDTHEGAATYIGNDNNGDITNGSGSGK